jgi:hypothetical protein
MPIYPNMTDEEIGYLGEGLKEVFHG